MQVTHVKPYGLHHTQLPESPCYLLRFEVGTGLEWIASASTEWRLSDGRPAVDAIASAAGITNTHVWRLKAAPTMPPGNKAMACLTRIGADAHGVSQETAHAHIFWLFDPANTLDVERLRASLDRAS